MADSHVDTTQQVTSQTPATKQKNPKRVAAGKAIAERTKMAREDQKKALIEAQSIIASKQAGPPSADPPPPVADTPSESTKNVLTTTQWLSVISIVVSLAGIYHKRKEIKCLLTKKKPALLHRPSPQAHLLILGQKEASPRWIANQLNFSYCFHNNGCSSGFH